MIRKEKQIMARRLKTLAIGIPAYNEANNIVPLLQSLLSQQSKKVVITEIIVASDGSSDDTVLKVKSLKDSRIRVIAGKKREGKSVRLNQIISYFTADLLLLLDADIVITDTNLLDSVVGSIKEKNFGVISVNAKPLAGRNMFESIINYSVALQSEIKMQWNKGNNYLSFKGVFLLLEKQFAKSLTLPDTLINNDGYIYFSAIAKNFEPKYFSNYSIYYRSPHTMAEHVSQSKRFQASQAELSLYFTHTLTESYRIPTEVIFFILLKYMIKNPIYFCGYALINILSQLQPTGKMSALWKISKSTKVSYQEGFLSFDAFRELLQQVRFQVLVYIRRAVYFTLYTLDSVLLKRKNMLFILCYHGISEDTWRFSIDYTQFVNQMTFLQKHYDFLSLDDIALYLQGKKQLTKPSVVITIDDGYRDMLKLKRFIKEMKIPITLFVLSDRKNADRKELDTPRAFLNKEEIMKLIREGWKIGSHGATHRDFYQLTDEQVTKEVVSSKTKLEKELQTKIHYFAYPRGRYTKSILAAVEKSGYQLGLSMDDGEITHQSNRFTIPRIGVDRTHSFHEFKMIYSPSVVALRGFIKKKMGIIL